MNFIQILNKTEYKSERIVFKKSLTSYLNIYLSQYFIAQLWKQIMLQEA